jgi:glycogen debranching enzyme
MVERQTQWTDALLGEASATNAASTQDFSIAAQASLTELRPRTLKHGDTFALFNRFGDLGAGIASPEGLYHEDIRFLSWLRFTIEGQTPLLLSSTVQSNNAMLDVDLVNPDLRHGDAIELPKDTIHISRMKFLWNAGCYEIFVVRNFDEKMRRVRLALEFDADFADIFEVRGFVRQSRGRVQSHNGSIWPHDNALIAMGLSRYGHSTEVTEIATAIFDAAAHMDLRRLPELFCGTTRGRDKGPILYPVACAPQAWAAAAPFGLLQACLGLEVDAAKRVVHLSHPRLPASLEWLRIRRLPVGGARLDLLLRRHDADVAVNVLHREGDVDVAVRL